MGQGAAEVGGGESAEVFRLLVESVVDYAIFLLDQQGYVRTWNAGARRIKGYGAAEIVGRHFSRFYTPEDVRAGKPAHGLATARAAGHWQDEGWRVRQDGSRFWASVAITALRDEGGRLVGFAKVTRDLTERRRAEEERARLQAEEQAARAQAAAAAALVAARDTFLAIAAHELKTPVTALRAMAQVLLRRHERGTLDPGQLAAYLRQLDAASVRLAALTDELLDVARVQAGQLALARAPLDVAALVAEAVARARLVAGGQHTFTLTTANHLPGVLGDAGRLEQVLTNLLDNAVKYSPDGGTIAVAARAAGAGVRVSVGDEGIGLPAGSEEAIFAPFGRAPNAEARRLPGLGLGLAICREIAVRHGGRLWAESAGEGRGTTFHLWLPAGMGAGEAPAAT